MLDKIAFVLGVLLYATLVIGGYLFCLLKVNPVIIGFFGGSGAFWAVHIITTAFGVFFLSKVWRYAHGLE